MRTTSKQLIGLLVIAITGLALLAGCSGGGGGDRFALCGDGRVDAGETCDDGNLSDSDDCLSTCHPARCGDTFVNGRGIRPEDCDGRLGQRCKSAPSVFCESDQECPTPPPPTPVNGVCQKASCQILGFGGGALSCTSDCTFDTSACVARATATPTFTSTATPTVTPTPKVSPTATPTAPTATPTTVATCSSLTVTVSLRYDVNAVPDLAGLVLDLNYPPSAVSIPGSGSDDAVVARVTDVSGTQGIPIVQDLDSNSDETDDQLHTVYAATQNIPSAPFEAVVFDCQLGVPIPTASAFACMVSQTNDSQGSPVEGVACIVKVDAP